MRRSNLILVLGIVFVALLSFSVYLRVSKPLEIVEHDVVFVVSDVTGIKLVNSSLDFGEVIPGGGARKQVILKNAFDFPARFDVFVSKNMEELLDVNSSFIVEPDSERVVFVSLNVPQTYEFGNYSGKIRFEMYRGKVSI